LIKAPILAFPNFNKPFEVETDAFIAGIGVLLQRERHPIDFITKALGHWLQNLSVYEKELLAVVFPVLKWE